MKVKGREITAIVVGKLVWLSQGRPVGFGVSIALRVLGHLR